MSFDELMAFTTGASLACLYFIFRNSRDGSD